MASPQDIFSFRSQFPEFAGVLDADVASIFNVANIYFDPTQWSATDFPVARLYWVAHMLTLAQVQAASISIEGEGAGLADVFLREIRIGERTISFGQRQSFRSSAATAGPGEEMLSYTYYGQFFLQLRARNIIPIAIV